MNKCFLFDVDGTLTPSREKINESFLTFLKRWVSNTIASKNKVFLTTGSDLPKLKEQVPKTLLNDISGYFCCMGNEYYSKGKLFYQTLNTHLKKGEQVDQWLNTQLKKSKYSKKFPPHTEFRTGMVNFSFVGRGCSTEQRRVYNEWDKKNKQRQKLTLDFNEVFKQKKIKAFVGGEISVDIQEEGSDKAQCIDFLKKRLKEHDFIFFGDRCESSGNDHSIYELCKPSNRWHVKNWEHTFEIITNNYLE
mgnify:CR=1 FL=1